MVDVAGGAEHEVGARTIVGLASGPSRRKWIFDRRAWKSVQLEGLVISPHSPASVRKQ